MQQSAFRSAALLTDAEDRDEDAVDDELPDGGPHVDLPVLVGGVHGVGGPHPAEAALEDGPAPALLLHAVVFWDQDLGVLNEKQDWINQYFNFDIMIREDPSFMRILSTGET